MRRATGELPVVTDGNLHRGEELPLHIRRTAAGDEVGLLAGHGARLVPVEIKASATPRPPMAEAIHRFRRDLGVVAAAGYVVHAGPEALPLGNGKLAMAVGADAILVAQV